MTPYYDVDGITIYHADNTEVVWPEPSAVGLLLTDPPYGISYQPGDLHSSVLGDEQPFDPAPLLAYERCVIWGGNHFAHLLPETAEWLVWEKRGRTDSTYSGLRVPDAELAWTNVTGRTRVFSDLWAGPLRREAFIHPTQKSVAVMRWILDQWTEPGDLIFDPYMGSGPVAQACADLGRRYFGIEIVEPYCAAAVHRLGQLTLSL